MADSERFDELMRVVSEVWPKQPPTRLSQESRMLFLAIKEALSCPNIVAAQRHLFCEHAAAFMIRPVFEMLFESLDKDVRKCVT